MDEEWDQRCGVHPDLRVGGVAVPPAKTDPGAQERTKKEVKFLPSYFNLLSHQTCRFVVAKQPPIS